MNEKVKEFTEEYTDVVISCERFSFLPRSIEYQKGSIEELTELLERSREVRVQVIQDEDEDAANQILALGCMIKAVRFELKMWVDLKTEEWDKAWNALVDAQDCAKSARIAHEIARQCNVENYLGKLENLEKLMFPSQNFNSPGLFVEGFTCSICGEDYSECKHIAGESYWGIFCQRIVDKIVGTREVALVDNPEDKKARITEHITDDDMIRDQMTWEKREMTEEEKERHKDDPEDHLRFSGIIMTASDSETDFSEYFPNH